MPVLRMGGRAVRARRWNRVRAWLGGYFWIPCAHCGREFGGHEWTMSRYASIPVDVHPHRVTSRAICPDCNADGVGFFAWQQLGGIWS